MSRVYDALRRGGQAETIALSILDLDSKHWLHQLLEASMEQFRVSGEITFETVRQLATHHQKAFLNDVETARRMYRTYPRLFAVEEPLAPGRPLVRPDR